MKNVMTVINELGKVLEDKNLTIEIKDLEIAQLRRRIEELETNRGF